MTVSSRTTGPGLDWREDFAPEHQAIILVLAPTGNDARLTAAFLAEAGHEAQIVGDLDELCRRMVAGCGAVLVAEEALSAANVGVLFGTLRRQPAWSDLPVILVASGGAVAPDRMQQLARHDTGGNISILERPFRPGTLQSAIDVALRSRRRQYETRQLLAQLEQARDAAERASSAKDNFLAALSHELRTPLNPVLLLATEGAGNPALGPDVRKDFEQIARNVLLEARLIDDLLDLTSITRGKLSLNLVEVDLHGAIHLALATTHAEIEEHQLKVVLELSAGQPLVLADPVRLQQVLWNILKNAAKFTPTGGMIHVSTKEHEGGISIRFSDTGIGMEPEELERVFEAFAQGNHARAAQGHRFGGLGLGLAITRRLVELHGGTITATSDGPRRGSTFTLSFPLAAPRPAPATAPGVRSSSANPFVAPRHLLLVEDHSPTRTAVKRLLERRGYVVAAAETLAEARTAAAAQHFDLLLSDLGLPDGSGYELMAELNVQNGLRGIALSGYGMEADIEQSRRVGFVEHLTKPVSVEALELALERAFAAGTSSAAGAR